jgi:alkylation response protein AidB-like acyl-CoA dehydrogenase
MQPARALARRRCHIQTLPSLDPPRSAARRSEHPADLSALVDRLQASAPDLDRECTVPTVEVMLLAEAGLLAAPVPRRCGGLGLGTEAGETAGLLAILSEIGRGNLALGRIYEGHVNALQLISTYGTPRQIERAARDARDGRLFGIWNTEGDDGVTIEPVDAQRCRLAGAKTFASGAGVVAHAIVPGRIPGGSWQMTLVPIDRVTTRTDPSWWRPIGMRGSASFKVDFTGVEIGRDDLLGTPGDYQRQPWLSGGAIRFAAVQLGGAEALFDVARSELRSLGRDGDPHQRARIGQAAIAIESGRLWLRGAAPYLDLAFASARDGTLDGPTSEQIVAYVNMARTAIERVCLDTIELVERSVGVRGMLAPHPMERLVRDLTIYLRQPAPDAALADAGRYALASAATASALWTNPG